MARRLMKNRMTRCILARSVTAGQVWETENNMLYDEQKYFKIINNITERRGWYR